ncbi:MAG: hypothetical protein Q8L40_04445 [Burkholderiales bacterium]|nr:hypothetical protein [Burkholderiales bacterium]
MTRLFSGIFLFLASFLAHAIEEQAAVQPPPADPTAMIVFAVVLFGGIGATAWVIWRNEKNRKKRENEEK